MGEQAKPVDDDVERALVSMRAGFLSGSEQVAAHIAALDQHLLDAPVEEREGVRAQVARLVGVHDRITARVIAAPPTAWGSFKVMVNAVKQQQDVLAQINHLVQQHVVPRQLAAAQAAAAKAAAEAAAQAAAMLEVPAPPPEPPPSPPLHDDLFPPRPLFPADDEPRADEGHRAGGGFRASDIFRSDPGFDAGAGASADRAFHASARDFRPQRDYAPQHDIPPQPAPPPRSAPRRQPRAQPPPQSRREADYRLHAPARGLQPIEEEDEERPSLLAQLRERTAGFRGLAAMLAVGIILSMLPRDRLQEAGTRLFELISPGGPELASDDAPPRAVPKVARSVDRVPSVAVAETTAPEARPDPRPEPKVEVKPRPSLSPSQKKIAAVMAEEDGDSPPPMEPAPKPPPPPAAAEEPVAAPSEPAADDGERFVAVVFTHKDLGTVTRALADLKQRYPRVLVGLEGEIQPVDMGKKGIWQRLVLLPAGPRPTAARVCAQLAAQGYDRCYVRTY